MARPLLSRADLRPTRGIRTGIIALRHAVEIGDSPWRYSGLGYVLGRAGQPHKAKEILNKLDDIARRQYVAPVYYAAIYAGLGDTDQALEYLRRAPVERNWLIACLPVDPLWEPIRSDSRLQAFQREFALGEDSDNPRYIETVPGKGLPLQ